MTSAVSSFLAFVALVAGPVTVSAAATVPGTRADCDAAEPWRVLAAVRSAEAEPREARAAWLNDSLIRWSGSGGEGRFRLVYSASAQLQVTPGLPVQGAQRGWALGRHHGRLPAEIQQRMAYLGSGVTLAVPRAASARVAHPVPDMLRGQLVLVQEDEAGRVLAATRVQPAAALDALYAPEAERLAYGASVAPRPARTPTSRAAPSPKGSQRAQPLTRWRLWAPTAQRVSLCLYGGADAAASAVHPMRPEPASGSWVAELAADAHGQAYTYLVDVMVPGRGLVRQRVTDPYALALTPDSRRSQVADLARASLQPPGWATTPRPDTVRAATDAVIYELHVRDFSAHDPTVAPEHRGRYGAFAQAGTDGVRHLKRLAAAGMTDVHLLPVFDFATVPEQGCRTPDIPVPAPDSEEPQARAQAHKADDCFNWGYDPLHFTAPEGSYAPPGADGLQRIVEFRRMVQALHAMGLRVGMDVVYNHTSASGQHRHSVLDRIVPGYYHRLNARGDVERSTCCDNTATEHRMMAKLMIDSAVVWARDHRIDAFRFDLMGHQPREAMERLQRAVDAATGRRIHLIGEGWNFGEVADGSRFVQASQLSLGGSGIGTFSDRARDAIRGGSAGDNGIDQVVNQGYVSGLYLAPNARAAAAGRGSRADLMRAADLVRVGLAGSLRSFAFEDHRGQRVTAEQIPYGGGQPAGYVDEPGEVVNYVENHDNQTLFDNLVFKLPEDTPPHERARAQTLASALVLLSQGIAYVHAGQELLRSKSMDRNSYDSGDAFNALDWSARDNGFGKGLPPRGDNGESWPLMQPLLARAGQIRPRPEDIAFARDAFLDLLRIRASTTLLRLRTAADIRQRLRLHNTGPGQDPAVMVAHLDGQGYAGAGFAELVVAVNVAPQARSIEVPALAGRAFEPHPVHRSATAADRRAASARHDPATGALELPPRTAVVFVR